MTEERTRERPYQKMEEYVRDNEAGLRGVFGNKYLTIRVYENDVLILDCDDNKSRLSRRIRGESKESRVFITKIEDIESFEKPQNSLRSPLKTPVKCCEIGGYSKSSILNPKVER